MHISRSLDWKSLRCFWSLCFFCFFKDKMDIICDHFFDELQAVNFLLHWICSNIALSNMTSFTSLPSAHFVSSFYYI